VVVVVVVVVLIVVVVVVVVFNAQKFQRIIFAFSHSIIIPQFMEYSHGLQLCQFGRST